MSNCKLCLADCAFKGNDMKKGNCKGYIPMTNADRIRAMSDEELENFLDTIYDFFEDGGGKIVDGNVIYPGNMLDWLQQPAEEDT